LSKLDWRQSMMGIRPLLSRSLTMAPPLGLAILLGAGSASGQGTLRGSAFAAVDQPGRAQQHCFADTLEKARSCALLKCRAAEGSGGAAPCQVTSACDRSGWAGFVAVKMRSASFTMTMCGVPSRVSLIARLKDLCRTYSTRGLEACSLDTVWTPDAAAETTSLVWTPRTLRRPGSAWR
jgi:hypothetical protein